jgi:hypothetical protein
MHHPLMNYDAVAVAGILLLVLISASVIAGSRVEYGGKLYQFRNSGPSTSSDTASGSKYKFRPHQRHSGSQAPAGRDIGGATENGQGYVFRPLRNRNRWIPGSEDIRQDAQACPAIEEKPRERSFSSPAYKPYRSRQHDLGGYQAPAPPPGGYLYPAAEILGYPPW